MCLWQEEEEGAGCPTDHRHIFDYKLCPEAMERFVCGRGK